jgi:hypothetical protein
MKPGPKPRTHGIDGRHTCVLGLQPDNIPLNCHTREVIERERERDLEGEEIAIESSYLMALYAASHEVKAAC